MSNAIRALMVTSDLALAKDFAQISRELGMEAQATVSTAGIPEELSTAKYEAVLLDFDTVPDALPIFLALRRNRSNQKAVLFAVATEAVQAQQARDRGANFLLARPLQNAEIRRVLHSAYDLMVGERRRYFRCAAELPVVLRHASSGTVFSCISMNMSSNGIAVCGPARFVPGDEVEITVHLRERRVAIRAVGTVVWDDRHGKTGICFACASPEHQQDLDNWLDSQLAIVLRSERPDQELSQPEV